MRRGPARNRCTWPVTTGGNKACWRTSGLSWSSLTPTVFGIPEVDRELDRKIAEYGIELRTNSELVAVNAAGRTATIRNNADHTSEDLPTMSSTPSLPQSAPDWLKTTDLPAVGDQYGFVEVDTQTLRHPRYPNVWSLGDAAGTTNSKAGGGAAQADQGSGKKSGLGPQRRTAQPKVQRILRMSVHRFAEHRGIRRVRPPIPAHANHPKGSHLEGKQALLVGGPRYVPAGLLAPDPQRPRVGRHETGPANRPDRSLLVNLVL